MIKDEYSPYKIVHHDRVVSEMRRSRPYLGAPLQVHFVVSNRCNQRCSFCAYRMHGYSSSETFNDRDIIRTDKVLEILDSLAAIGTKAIQYTGGGEPLVHPGIVEIFKRTHRNGLDLSLVSNGDGLNDEIIDQLTEALWVRISVDSSDPDMYAKLRNVRSSTFYRVAKNIEKLAKTRSSSCVLGIGYVMTRENWFGVYDACRFFRDLGVDNFRISALFTDKGIQYFDGWLEDAKRLSAKCKSDFNSSNFEVFNLFNDRIADLFNGVQDYDYCPMKDLVIYIGADLKVYTCCILAYTAKGYVGSLENQTFEQLWNSDDRKRFYMQHSPRQQCRLPCMFERKNHFINYCVKHNPKHVNYI